MAETWRDIALHVEENLKAATVRVILDKADKTAMFYI
jgi:hypothetical protein